MSSRTTIRTSLILDDLCIVRDTAKAELELKLESNPAGATTRRWLNALSRAWEWLAEQDEITVLDLETDHAAVLIPSASQDGVCYAANGDCSCTAHRNGWPCWHRAASRLVRKALRRVLEQAAAAEGTTLDALLNKAAARRRRAHEQTRALAARLQARQGETPESRLERARREILECF